MVIPRDFAATMSGSTVEGVDCEADVEGGMYVDGDVISLDAFSNSRFAWAIDLAISGSFCGPHRKTTTSITTTLMSSNPTSAKFVSHRMWGRRHIRMVGCCEV